MSMSSGYQGIYNTQRYTLLNEENSGETYTRDPTIPYTQQLNSNNSGSPGPSFTNNLSHDYDYGGPNGDAHTDRNEDRQRAFDQSAYASLHTNAGYPPNESNRPQQYYPQPDESHPPSNYSRHDVNANYASDGMSMYQQHHPQLGDNDIYSNTSYSASYSNIAESSSTQTTREEHRPITRIQRYFPQPEHTDMTDHVPALDHLTLPKGNFNEGGADSEIEKNYGTIAISVPRPSGPGDPRHRLEDSFQSGLLATNPNLFPSLQHVPNPEVVITCEQLSPSLTNTSVGNAEPLEEVKVDVDAKCSDDIVGQALYKDGRLVPILVRI